MNITLRMKDEKSEKEFLAEAEKRGMIELAGHRQVYSLIIIRSVGGIRASLYNAITVEQAQTLVDFMKEFSK